MSLCLTLELQVRNVKIFSDSQLVVNQVNDIYFARGEKMVAYFDNAKEQLSLFSTVSIKVIPRSKNSNVGALAKLASTKDTDLLDAFSVEFLAELNIHPQQGIMELTQEPLWMDLIVTYLKIGEQPKDKTEAQILWLKAVRYVLYDDKLYRRCYSMPLLKCVTALEAKYIMREIHEGTCRNHIGGQSLAFKAIRRLLLANHEDELHGICPQMRQVPQFTSISKVHLKELTSMTNPWPFAIWRIDLIDRLPKGRGSVQYAVMAVDYFTKSVEAEVLASIRPAKINEFIYKNNVYRYGVPHTIIFDHGT